MPSYKILIRDVLDPDVKARLKIKSKLSLNDVKEKIRILFQTSPDTKP